MLLTLFLTSAFGQSKENRIRLSHKITTETKMITGFNKIDVSEDFQVIIRFSDKVESVEIEANENLHDLIQVEKHGETLKIYTNSYSTASNEFKTNAEEKLVAYITAKSLSEIRGDEDVEIKLENKLKVNDLTIYLDEDSTLEGQIEVDNLIVKLEEDSELEINGAAQKMKVKANEDSIIKSFDFVVNDLEIILKDESEAELTVNGNIDLLARGESSFHYKGNGNFTRKRVTGESEVKSR